ncbi:phage holin family protein [Frigoribacterium sp. PhB118]|uniref:phage holin family protein n=1 Tax=Frigoribacterium sp. PhB118 TaxID=2485175 RepID=UPI000F46A3A4|nr:phage holin family protein [Frigoribacterium sp. PhB118]ROS53885.1 putative superfamily III holin-X [Frigoribacterium sp. PhB118]
MSADDDKQADSGFAGRFRDQLGSRAIEPIIKAVRAELRSARDEVAGRARDARSGVVFLAVGAVLAIVTVILLAGTAVALLALALPLWAAALITFAAFAIVTAVLVAVGLKGVKRGVPPVPVDTVKNLTSSSD